MKPVDIVVAVIGIACLVLTKYLPDQSTTLLLVGGSLLTAAGVIGRKQVSDVSENKNPKGPEK
jgi:hypothetical protein